MNEDLISLLFVAAISAACVIAGAKCIIDEWRRPELGLRGPVIYLGFALLGAYGLWKMVPLIISEVR